MGSAAIGLGGAGIGIGLVFASLLTAVARNPSLRGQLFSYAILGFAFVSTFIPNDRPYRLTMLSRWKQLACSTSWLP